MPNDALKHVFIVTYGRSGSTVVQRVLQSIPGYVMRGENNHTLYPLFLAYRRAYEARYSHGQKQHSREDPWYGADAIDPARFGAKLAHVFRSEILQPPEGARVVGFKEIRFHEAGEDLFEPYLNFIYDMFPGSKFIFNTRHWQAVSKSSWWATMDPDNVRRIIEGADSLYQTYHSKHADRCHLMRYEDHAGNPDAYAPLFEFLGETFDHRVVAEQIKLRLKHAGKVVGGPVESRRKLTP